MTSIFRPQSSNLDKKSIKTNVLVSRGSFQAWANLTVGNILHLVNCFLVLVLLTENGNYAQAMLRKQF